MSHEKVETNIGLMAILIVLVISVGGLVEIVPLFALDQTTKPAPGVEKYDALAIEGRDVYIREGCYNCHSQMIRPFRAETERYGHYSVRVSRCTTIRSSGAPSVPVRTWPAWEPATATTGTMFT